MSASTYELIGQIIHPRPVSFISPQPLAPARPMEPSHVLIGRIINPEWPARPAISGALVGISPVNDGRPSPTLEVPMPM